MQDDYCGVVLPVTRNTFSSVAPLQNRLRAPLTPAPSRPSIALRGLYGPLRYRDYCGVALPVTRNTI